MEPEQPKHPRAGERVRLKVDGARGSYTVEGRLLALSHKGVDVSLANDRPITIPAKSVVTLYVIGDNGAWTEESLPSRLEELIEPLRWAFVDSSGKYRKQLSDNGLNQTLALAERAARDLFDQRLKNCAQHLVDALQQLQVARSSQGYETVDAARQSCMGHIAAGRAAIPTTYANDLGPLTEAFAGAEALVSEFWRGFIAEFDPRPRFISQSKPAKVYFERGGEVSLPLRVKLESSTAPATAVSVVLAESDDIEFLASPPAFPSLAPGVTKTVRHPAVFVARSDRNGRARHIRLRAQLRYKTPSGEVRTSPMQTLQYEVVPKEPFKRISNPFSPYAGGTTVADPRMFFGRAALLERVASEMREGPAGQGLAIYGQKRSGKTSLVEQLRARVNRKPVIVISISLGILDRENLTASFARAILEKARVSLLGELDGAVYAHVSRLWPSDDRIAQRPLESLTSALSAGHATLSRQPGWAGLRYVLLVDEFTYLFELLRSSTEADMALHGDVREFLRQWKALLESRVFSAVVVGQDTMPYFMQLFPNEFSMLRPIRLSYLSESETMELADRPIQKPDGTSRYGGYALENIYQYTAGHPYFTQVLCDRIVDLANERARAELTEMDVDEAADSLMSGPDPLDPYRFDCLLTADNSGLVPLRTDGQVEREHYDPRADDAYSLLARIAILSGSSERRVPRADLELTELENAILDDLKTRDVVDDNGGIRIKVHLFSEYLRRTAL